MADKKVSVEELPDFKTILEYIQTEYKLKVPQNGLETEAKEVLCHKLHHLTEKRVLDFYNKFLEANYYHCVTVDAFVDRIKNFPIMPLSTLERERTIEL